MCYSEYKVTQSWYNLDIKRITIRMPKDKHIKLKIQAATKDSTLEQIVLDAVDMYIQSNCK